MGDLTQPLKAASRIEETGRTFEPGADNVQAPFSEQPGDSTGSGLQDDDLVGESETLAGITDRALYLAMSPAVGLIQLRGPMLRRERATTLEFAAPEAAARSENSGAGGMCGLCCPSHCRVPYCMDGGDQL